MPPSAPWCVAMRVVLFVSAVQFACGASLSNFVCIPIGFLGSWGGILVRFAVGGLHSLGTRCDIKNPQITGAFFIRF